MREEKGVYERGEGGVWGEERGVMREERNAFFLSCKLMLVSLVSATIISSLYSQSFYISQDTPNLNFVGESLLLLSVSLLLSLSHTHRHTHAHTKIGASMLINRRWWSGYCQEQRALH